MAKVTVVTKLGVVCCSTPDAHVSMEPDSREVIILDGENVVMESFSYDEVDDIKVECL